MGSVLGLDVILAQAWYFTAEETGSPGIASGEAAPQAQAL